MELDEGCKIHVAPPDDDRPLLSLLDLESFYDNNNDNDVLLDYATYQERETPFFIAILPICSLSL